MSTKISALSTVTLDRVADFVPFYDASGVTNGKALASNFGAYVIPIFFPSPTSPADSTTYVFTPYPNLGTLSITAVNHKVFIPRAGKIIAAYLSCLTSSTLATAENSTVSIRLNDTTDTTVSSVVLFNAVHTEYSNTALGITVAAGDFITGKIATPAWVTNPTNIYMRLDVFVA